MKSILISLMLITLCPLFAHAEDCKFNPNPPQNFTPRFGDGRNGTLYKPQSDTRPGAVVVLDSRFGQRTKSMYLQCSKGRTKRFTNAGGANPDRGFCRDHWRLSFNGDQIAKRFGRRCHLVINNSIKLFVGNPRKRKD